MANFGGNNIQVYNSKKAQFLFAKVKNIFILPEIDIQSPKVRIENRRNAHICEEKEETFRLEQGSQTCGPRAKKGPPTLFSRPETPKELKRCICNIFDQFFLFLNSNSIIHNIKNNLYS